MNESINQADFAAGAKVISYALNILAWGTACAVAWSCSTLLMGIIMFIVMSIVMALLCALVQLVIFFKVPAPTIEGLGRTVGGGINKVTGLFSRKASA